MNIIVFDSKPYDEQYLSAANKSYGFHLTFSKNHLNVHTAQSTKGYDVVCVFVNDTLSSDVIDCLKANGVSLIALRCAGYNNVDLKAVFGSIHVVRVPAYSPYAVAEHAVSLMLTLNRKTHKAYARTHENNFSIQGLLGFDMYKKTAGVVGTGKIGKVLCTILRGFGMRILAYDRFPDQELAQTGVVYTDLPTLYKESDIISLHCPLSKDTHYLINDTSIACMKKGVMIINTGRGKLIDTKALIKGLKSQHIGSAGLDVYEEESEYFFEDFSHSFISDDMLARLLSFPNVLITAHQAFFTDEAMRNIAETTLKNIADFQAGKGLTNEICYKCDKMSTCPRKSTGVCF